MFALYGMRVSPRSKKVQWALEESGAPYQYVPVDARSGETRTPEFLRINPLGTVPALAHEGFSMCEANAILGYVADVAGGALAFKGPADRAQAHQWLFWEASTIGEPIHRAWLAKFRARMGQPDDPAMPARAVDESRNALGVLDARLVGRAFVATDRFGIADVAIGATLSQCIEAGIDLAPWPNIVAWLARVQARPAFARVYAEG